MNYFIGADFSGYTTNNKLANCESFLRPCELERVVAETSLAELEARVIEVESKRAKEEEEEIEKKVEEDVMDDVNSESSGEATEEKLEENHGKETLDSPDTNSAKTQTRSSDSDLELHMEYVETCTFDTDSKEDLFDDD